MKLLAFALLALAYAGLVLFTLAHALRRLVPPRRAAWTAFGLSLAVHGASALFAEPERRLPLALFVLVPHLLVLLLLLLAARRQGGA